MPYRRAPPQHPSLTAGLRCPLVTIRPPILQVRDDGLRKLPGSSTAAEILRTRLGALQGRFYACLHPIGLFAVAEVDEHVLGREQRRERVGPVLSGVLRGRAVDGFEDRDLLTYVRPRGDAEPTGEPGTEVREDVAVEVGADQNVVEVRFHDELHAHVVDDAVVYLLEVVLVVLGDLEEDVTEQSVRELHDVGLVDDGDVLAALFFRPLEGHPTDALSTLAGDDLDRLRRMLADGVLYAGVEVLGVLAVDDDVDALIWRLHPGQAQGRPDVPVEVELLAKRHVYGPEPRPDG